MKNTFSIQDDFVNSRLDRWFRRQVSDVPQSLIEKNLRKGNIKVNKKKSKSSYNLQKNDQIYISDFKFTTSKSKKKYYDYKPTKKELVSKHTTKKYFHISTAKNGFGETRNSFKTPRGWHYIRATIGRGLETNT